MDENGSEDAKPYTTKNPIRAPSLRNTDRAKMVNLVFTNYGRVGAAELDDVVVVPDWFIPRLMIIFTSTRRFC